METLTTDKKRAAGYIRVSQERAAANGYGLDAQETDVRRYAEYKGVTHVHVYREQGVSGYKKDRPALERLLADAQAGRFGVAVFPSIDRAGRSVRDVIEIDTALREAGVTIVFLRGEVDDIMEYAEETFGREVADKLRPDTENRARNWGGVFSLKTAGFTEYEIRAVMDERTSPICRRMHKKVFRVEEAMSNVERALSSAPSAIETIAPFPRYDVKQNDHYLTVGGSRRYLSGNTRPRWTCRVSPHFCAKSVLCAK